MLVLLLDDAVKVAKQLVIDGMDDEEIISQEMEQKCWIPPETNEPAKRLNNLIFDINPAEICSQIESDNLKNWCEIMQTEMKMAMVKLPSAEDLQPTCNHVATDCISRQALLDAFGLSDKTRKYGGDHSGYDTRMLYEIQQVIEDMPSAKRKTGRWISLDDFRGKYNECGYKCSECGEHCDYEENYCPNCGAKMEVEHD